MPKTPNCESCLYYAYNFHLVCAVHPNGQNSDFCPDFQTDPDTGKTKFIDFLGLLQLEGDCASYRQRSDGNCNEPFDNPFSLDSDEEQWQPEGAGYYNGELILQRGQWSKEQLWLSNNHPLFTGVCPQCSALFE